MKIGFYDEFRPCVLKENGVIDISEIVTHLQISSPQIFMQRIIVNFEELRQDIQKIHDQGTVIPLDQVRLRPPLPRPGKILAGQGNYMEGVKIDPARPLQSFFKSPEAIIGPGDTITLPAFRPTIFNHEAELAVVIGKEAKNIQEHEALDHVFGYTTGVDVSARAPEEGEADLPGTVDAHYGKSFDTFLPIGPAITTADEVENPNNLQIQYWVNGELRQNYNTNDMEHSIAYTIATLSHVMTLKPGDLLIGGTNHSHLGPLQDGDTTAIEIESIGRTTNQVQDALNRSWDPHDLRQPEALTARRESMRDQPNAGTWPFNAVGGKRL